jgi:hypothetical protein
MTGRQGLRWVLGGLGLALLFTAAPAGANECADICNDARTLCQRAAVATARSRWGPRCEAPSQPAGTRISARRNAVRW